MRHDQRDGLGDGAGLADDLDGVAELGAHPGAEQPVVVDEHDPQAALTGRHLEPDLGALPRRACATTARPPWRSIRPTTDCARPYRSSGTAAGSKPLPRSRTKTSTRSSPTSA